MTGERRDQQGRLGVCPLTGLHWLSRIQKVAEHEPVQAPPECGGDPVGRVSLNWPCTQHLVHGLVRRPPQLAIAELLRQQLGQALQILRAEVARHLRGNRPHLVELRRGERDWHCDCPPNVRHAGVLRPFSACWRWI